METVGGRSVGMSVKRVEDPRILSGKGNYLDDVTLPGMLHAAFLRSAVPHGTLLSVDASEARALPGVVAVYTGEDLTALTEPVPQGGDVSRQVRTAALLAGLDQHQAPTVGAAGGPHRLEGAERGKGVVAVVGPTPAVEALALQYRGPGAETFPPTGQLRLLVQVAVKQHGVVGVARSVGRHLDEHDRGSARQLVDLDGRARQGAGSTPLGDQVDGLGQVAVSDPVGVVGR